MLPPSQVLLWNYPGQAFSEWREEQLLNNDYLSTILQALLIHLGKKSAGGTGVHLDGSIRHCLRVVSFHQ